MFKAYKAKWSIAALATLAIVGFTAHAAKVDSTMFIYLEDVSRNIIWSGDFLTIGNNGTFTVKSGATWTIEDGTIPRADLAEDALAKFEVPVINFTTGLGQFSGLYPEGGTGGITIKTADVDNDTVTETTSFHFRLPENYVAGGDVNFSMSAKYIVTGDGVAGASNDIDVLAYEVSQTAGTVGSDICATALQAVTASYAIKLFTITATNLVAGDLVKVTVNMRVHDSDAGAGTITGIVLAPHFQCDVKG